MFAEDGEEECAKEEEAEGSATFSCKCRTPGDSKGLGRTVPAVPAREVPLLPPTGPIALPLAVASVLVTGKSTRGLGRGDEAEGAVLVDEAEEAEEAEAEEGAEEEVDAEAAEEETNDERADETGESITLLAYCELLLRLRFRGNAAEEDDERAEEEAAEEGLEGGSVLLLR